METQKPRRLTSTVLSLMLVLSVLAVMNFTSMNALADDVPWNNGHTVSGTEWYENCNITMQGGDLTIPNGTTLVFNDSVTFKIICPEAGDWGITIESGGKFDINSTSANTIITYGSVDPLDTYFFLNSGTIDFLGANVTRVYGDSDDPDTTGGIRNLPGSNCTLENCNILDGDTHGIYVEGNSEFTCCNC